MASLSQAKTYGGLGAILTLFLPVPYLGFAVAIAGFVLMLVAVKYISDIVKDSSIVNDMVISIIAAIVGVVVGFFVIFGSFMRFIGLNNLVGPDFFGPNFNPATIPVGDWVGLVGSVLLGLVAMWAALIVSGVYLRRGYNRVAKALNVGMFGTAGLLFLIGAATTVIFVGFLLIPVALILLAVAFFSIKDNISQVQPTQGYSPAK